MKISSRVSGQVHTHGLSPGLGDALPVEVARGVAKPLRWPP